MTLARRHEIKLTARARLDTWANVSRVQSDEVTYDLERTVVGSAIAGATADRCGQCGACDRSVVSVAVGDREIGDMEITEAAYAEAQMEIERLRTALENLRAELAMANNSFGSQTADWPGLAGRIEDLKTHCREMYVAKQKAEAEREADKALMRLALRVLNASIDVPAYGGHPAEEAVAAALRERLGEVE